MCACAVSSSTYLPSRSPLFLHLDTPLGRQESTSGAALPTWLPWPGLHPRGSVQPGRQQVVGRRLTLSVARMRRKKAPTKEGDPWGSQAAPACSWRPCTFTPTFPLPSELLLGSRFWAGTPSSGLSRETPAGPCSGGSRWAGSIHRTRWPPLLMSDRTRQSCSSSGSTPLRSHVCSPICWSSSNLPTEAWPPQCTACETEKQDCANY